MKNILSAFLFCAAASASACQGPAGTAGTPGLNGHDGQDGSMGLPGTSGKDGVAGTPGAQGATGAMGAQGIAGKDGASLAQTLQAVLDRVVSKKAAIVEPYCYKPCDSGTPAGGCTTDGFQWWRGTGTKLADGTVLTAQHVVEGATGCVINGEASGEMGRMSSSKQPVAGRDLTILSVTWNTQGKALPTFDFVRGHSPALGELTLDVSFPGTLDRTLVYGFGYVVSTDVTASFDPAEKVSWSAAWGFDGVATHGSSGSPVFDSRGDLIGILVGGPADPQLEVRFVLPILGL